ncbi:hypothetical protein PF003_g6477 [Phytophthora fragariae]|nr:hypothetical protein PF003_g6477 [Phytophthora fragariae]
MIRRRLLRPPSWTTSALRSATCCSCTTWVVMEIAALRYLSRQPDCPYGNIVATTKIAMGTAQAVLRQGGAALPKAVNGVWLMDREKQVKRLRGF